jgi:hypothetical protein
MTKCLKCGGTEIIQGKVEGYQNAIFAPEGLRYLTVTLNHGTMIEPESYACLDCGSVWSQTDPHALKDFIAKHCKKP